MLGIAVATRVPAVGGTVPHLRAGVGAVATQALANPYIGFHGIDLLARGASAEAVRDAIVAWDPDITRRQFAILDARGGAAAFTGSETQPHAGHRTGDGFAVAGNLLAGPAVIDAMVASFEEPSDDDLAERLLRAIEAGQAAGGDSRGKQSAALHVVDREAWSYLDLRVDEHPDPIVELRRVLGVWREVALPYLPSRPTRADLEERSGRTGPSVEDHA
jgi:uncharacterized Ntn-hydrolase superfamily protein